MLHGNRVARGSFSPDGKRILTWGWDGVARFWDRQAQPVAVGPIVHGGPILDASYSPNGQFIITASEDHTARIWEASSGRPLSPPLVHPGTVNRSYFSPDGMTFLTSSMGRPYWWEAATGLPLPLPFQATGETVAEFIDDGRALLALAPDETVRVWSLTPDERPASSLIRLAEALACRNLDPTSGTTPLDSAEWLQRWKALNASPFHDNH